MGWFLSVEVITHLQMDLMLYCAAKSGPGSINIDAPKFQLLKTVDNQAYEDALIICKYGKLTRSNLQLTEVRPNLKSLSSGSIQINLRQLRSYYGIITGKINRSSFEFHEDQRRPGDNAESLLTLQVSAPRGTVTVEAVSWMDAIRRYV
jgi:hypothetical protein